MDLPSTSTSVTEPHSSRNSTLTTGHEMLQAYSSFLPRIACDELQAGHPCPLAHGWRLARLENAPTAPLL